MTTSQKHAELKKLGKQARQNLYDMIRLVNEILQDHEYVDQFGGEAQLIEHMQAEDFAHWGGKPSLDSMLRAYRANPKKAIWEEYKFDIWAMIELAQPEKDGADTTRINWKALAKELQTKLDAANALVSELRSSNDDLRRKSDAAIAEAAEMRGRISVLETFARRVA